MIYDEEMLMIGNEPVLSMNRPRSLRRSTGFSHQLVLDVAFYN